MVISEKMTYRYHQYLRNANTPLFLLAPIVMTLVMGFLGFSFQPQSVILSIIFYFLLLLILNSELRVPNNIGIISIFCVISCALISSLAFSDSDYLRGFDASMLILSLLLIVLHFLFEEGDKQNLLMYSLFISISNSTYALLIENLRSSGFISLINQLQITITLFVLGYSIYIFNRGKLPLRFIYRSKLLAVGFGCLLVLLKSEKTDFNWDSPIWGVLIWIYSSCLFYWIISGKNREENRIKRNFSQLELASLGILLCAFFLLPGFLDDHETRKHVVYHLGLFSLLSENAVQNGIFHVCNDVELPPGSSGTETGEPGGCWVYPAGWWSLPVWFLAPFILLGLDGIYISRLLSFVLRCVSVVLISLIVKRYSNRPAAPIFTVIAFVACTQVSHYGRIYTWQQFEDIFILLSIILWIPIIMGTENITRNRLFGSVLFSSLGPIILGFGASAVSCYLAASFVIVSNANIRKKLAVFSIVFISSIMSWVIWDFALQYYYQNPNAAEDLLFWKINYRSTEGRLLFSYEYYLEMMIQSAYLLGPLLCMGIISMTSKFRLLIAERDLFSEKAIIITVFSPFIFLWLVNTVLFPQMGFSHDYLAFWTLTPALSAIAGDLLSEVDKKIAFSSLASVLLVFSNEFAHYEGTIHDPDMVPLHHWARENIVEGDSVLLSHDLYKEHYIAAISGDQIYHYYQTSSSETIHDAINSLGVDVIITNSSGKENWELDELTFEGWCIESFPGKEFEYHAMKICD